MILTLDRAAGDTATEIEPIEDKFEAFIEAADFPCVGAKSASARGNLTMVRARDLRSGWNDLEIHERLMDWAAAHGEDDGALHSFAVLFAGPDDLNEDEFERLMWERIQSFADKDAWLGQRYASTVSRDPQDPHFALSFGGKAFFAVGLHPHASRPARRFAHPAIVFNPHDQFERLREQNRYGRMREAIMARDAKLAGSTNPMLADHGEASAAPQYSGRQVGGDWKCPFRDKRS
ncbi:MAG: guanitoxin biosynthesis heme-dependent pre-guanitoxin N-hydroxylase GntA [Pseudomonadota bacterium]|nr:guanitoxin biosynthesis heme-dependent pre-guanitoxin N-hydroxylase GntA [Pseudomonadota bacterium]